MVTPRTALWLDAVGCGIGGVLLILSETIWSWTDLPESWRIPVAITLLVFAMTLVSAAIFQTRSLYTLAVAGNALWIIGGVIALFSSGTPLGWVIILVVIVADGAMAYLQSRPLLQATTN